MDITKITRAVAIAETGNGKTGSGKDFNNICGLMYGKWIDGVKYRYYYKYDTYMDGFNACSRTLRNSPSWNDKKYVDMTIDEAADLWTGGDRVEEWKSNVRKYYNKNI